jgi:hypothetical protein
MIGHNKKASPSNTQGQGKTPAIIKMARITKTFHPITTPLTTATSDRRRRDRRAWRPHHSLRAMAVWRSKKRIIMLIRQAAKKMALQLPAIRRIVRQRDEALARVRELESCQRICSTSLPDNQTSASYTMLRGTEYSRYAMPLDYLPSRALRPRWGETHPVIASLAQWMGGYDDDYRIVLEKMQERARRLAAIPLNFDHDRPEPAWLGVPFAPFDSAALYTLVGHYEPCIYLEIGSGITTAFAHRSICDHGLNTRIVSIDPQPRAAIDAICNEVIRDGLETCDLTLFDALEPGDIVFLDGSH